MGLGRGPTPGGSPGMRPHHRSCTLLLLLLLCSCSDMASQDALGSALEAHPIHDMPSSEQQQPQGQPEEVDISTIPLLEDLRGELRCCHGS